MPQPWELAAQNMNAPPAAPVPAQVMQPWEQASSVQGAPQQKTLEQRIDPFSVIPKVEDKMMGVVAETPLGQGIGMIKDAVMKTPIVGPAIASAASDFQQGTENLKQKDPFARTVLNAANSDVGKTMMAAIPAEGALEKFSAEAALTPKNITADMEKAEAQKAYQYADKVGGVISPQGRNEFVNTVNSLHPPSSEVPVEPVYQNVLDTINAKKDRPLTLKGAQDIDEYLGDKINGEVMNNGQLSSTGKKLLDVQTTLRQYTRDPNATNIIGGDQGFKAWQEGQARWHNQAQLRDIQQIIEKATAPNVGNQAQAIQNGFGRLMVNPKRFKQYSPAAQDLIQKAAEGSVAVDALKSMGSRLLPIIAGATHGPLAGIAGEAVSQIGKSGAAAVQLGKANKVAKAIVGKDWKPFIEPTPTPQPVPPTLALPSPTSAMAMPADQIAAARAAIKPVAPQATNGTVPHDYGDVPYNVINAAPETPMLALAAPGQLSRLPMTAEEVARARASIRASSGETGGVPVSEGASGNATIQVYPRNRFQPGQAGNLGPDVLKKLKGMNATQQRDYLNSLMRKK